MIRIRQGRWSIACVCMVLGFMVAVQLRTTADMKGSVSYQRIEEITARLLTTEQERDGLKEELSALRKQKACEAGGTISEDIRLRAGLTPVEGEGIIVKLEDSSATAKAGENPNLYLIHDDDLLNVHALAGISIHFLLYPFTIASKVLNRDIVRIYFEFIKTGEIS